ncbi:MAG TPA: hypothetical protein VH054_11330 [Polyangiaceae bacterium]|nr:hypothetical protein [Polyangiaceae bacterium]
MSFFSATMEQLKAAAPGWIEPKYGEKLIEMIDPFTHILSHQQHELLSEPPPPGPDDEILTLIKKGRAFKWRFMVNGLDSLMKLLTNAPEAAIAELHQSALLGPVGSDAVCVIPETLVDALTALKPSDVAPLAASWQTALRWDSPPKELLEELIEVAREARAAGHRMFLFGCL